LLGLIAFEFGWDFATATREYARARALRPSWMHQWYFRYLLATNHPSEAGREYAVRHNGKPKLWQTCNELIKSGRCRHNPCVSIRVATICVRSGVIMNLPGGSVWTERFRDRVE
jgi:hypothetical protein